MNKKKQMGRPTKGPQKRTIGTSLRLTKLEASRIELLQVYLNLLNGNNKLSKTDIIVRGTELLFKQFEDGILNTLQPNYQSILERINETK